MGSTEMARPVGAEWPKPMRGKGHSLKPEGPMSEARAVERVGSWMKMFPSPPARGSEAAL